MASKKTTDHAAVEQATRDLQRALQAARKARKRLAAATRPGAPYKVVASDLRWADELLQKHRKALLSIDGVVGVGLGCAMTANRQTDERCITVFVKKKRSLRQLERLGHKKIPRAFTKNGRRIRVDVIELGGIKRHAQPGASIGPADDASEGTIGVFARDLDTDRVVAITAMHVSGADTFTGPVEFRIPSLRVGASTKRLGQTTDGTTQGIDAAKIALDDQDSASNSLPCFGAVNGWRPVHIPGDEGQSVSMVGARSGCQSGTIRHVAVDLPGIGIETATIADIIAAGGDSGAALLDQERNVLGFLVGQADGGPYDGLMIFCSAAAVVHRLNIDF